MRIVVALAAFGVSLGGTEAHTQAPASPQPHFEVASIKPNRSGDPHGTISALPGGRYVAANVTLLQLVAQAHGLQSSQLIGGPDWIRTDRFDVVAKADRDIQSLDAVGAARFSPLQLMLQALLTDRFKLGVHTEPREMSVYVLVLARTDRSLGPKMRASSTDCAAELIAARGRAGGPPPASFNEPLTCGLRMGHGRLSAVDATIAQLLPSLSNTVQRVVHDRTGLTDRYHMEMSWTPDRMPQSPAVPSAGASSLPPVDPNGTSIFTALQEQLGLKLESARAPVDVLVIDRVERPTPD
jgi:uncharacterized protein (TIGR03435 family)